MFLKLAGRDVAILALGAFAWPLAAPFSAGTGAVGDLAGFLLGLLLGACAFLVHEWGHFLGALATGSVVHPPTSLRSPFVFRFDSRANSRRQFLVMSLAGFVATGVVVWGAYSVLAPELLATRVARGAVLFLALLTVVLEFPLVAYALVTRRVPPIDGLDSRKQPEQAAA